MTKDLSASLIDKLVDHFASNRVPPKELVDQFVITTWDFVHDFDDSRVPENYEELYNIVSRRVRDCKIDYNADPKLALYLGQIYACVQMIENLTFQIRVQQGFEANKSWLKRREIVDLLTYISKKDSVSFTQLNKSFSCTERTLKKHLEKLDSEELPYLIVSYKGNVPVYKLSNEGFKCLALLQKDNKIKTLFLENTDNQTALS